MARPAAVPGNPDQLAVSGEVRSGTLADQAAEDEDSGWARAKASSQKHEVRARKALAAFSAGSGDAPGGLQQPEGAFPGPRRSGGAETAMGKSEGASHGEDEAGPPLPGADEPEDAATDLDPMNVVTDVEQEWADEDPTTKDGASPVGSKDG